MCLNTPSWCIKWIENTVYKMREQFHSFMTYELVPLSIMVSSLKYGHTADKWSSLLIETNTINKVTILHTVLDLK